MAVTRTNQLIWHRVEADEFFSYLTTSWSFPMISLRFVFSWVDLFFILLSLKCTESFLSDKRNPTVNVGLTEKIFACWFDVRPTIGIFLVSLCRPLSLSRSFDQMTNDRTGLNVVFHSSVNIDRSNPVLSKQNHFSWLISSETFVFVDKAWKRLSPDQKSIFALKFSFLFSFLRVAQRLADHRAFLFSHRATEMPEFRLSFLYGQSHLISIDEQTVNLSSLKQRINENLPFSREIDDYICVVSSKPPQILDLNDEQKFNEHRLLITNGCYIFMKLKWKSSDWRRFRRRTPTFIVTDSLQSTLSSFDRPNKCLNKHRTFVLFNTFERPLATQNTIPIRRFIFATVQVRLVQSWTLSRSDRSWQLLFHRHQIQSDQ